MKKDKGDVFKLLLLIFSLSLILFWIYLATQNEILKEDVHGLSYIETIHTGVQRVSKLELESSPDDQLIVLLDTTATRLSNHFSENSQLFNITEEFVLEWTKFKESVTTFRDTDDRDSLFIASENNYETSTKIVLYVKNYIAEFTEFVEMIKSFIVGHIIILALLLIKIIVNTVSELQRNKELSKDMNIDTSTGLYNRSKCQEMINMPLVSYEEGKERIVLVFDLNDLKRTNDLQGHRMGDELIFHFAKQLKEATKVVQYEVFVGRYGGDEFIAYFSCADEKDVELYLEELNYLVDKFNSTENKPFKLSFAVGHSITSERTKSFTMRQLFDIADSNMYLNKMAMKELMKQELREKAVDDEI